MNNNFEILAPAGSMENLKAAVFAGANSIYLGVQSFNARASAANFSFEELKQAVGFCHGRNVTVNVTLNTILYDTELESFSQTVKQVAACGVDAVILQDLAAAQIVKNITPQLARHASTQMAVHNLEGALLLKEMGYTRVILARELSFEQVKYITQNCGIETEVFVHGALCVCLSGQCYASAFLGGRSGNRGRCAGTCRLPMSARGDLEDNHLSLKDLCALDLVKQLKEIGVKSVKIEGRLRTPEYVAGAVDATAKAAESLDFDKQLLADTFSRSGFTNAFLENSLNGDVFGVRTQEDSKKTKEALPKLRELYRREGQRVPVRFSFKMGQEKSILSITDGKNTFEKEIEGILQPSTGDFAQSVKNSLSKLGGTPFYADNVDADIIEGMYIPLAAINEGRRELTEKLLAARSVINNYYIKEFTLPQNDIRTNVPKLTGSFYSTRQLSQELCQKFEFVFIPIEQAESIPEYAKEKAVLILPRDMFNGTNLIKEQISKAGEKGYNKFCVQNIGHIPLVKGKELFSSFTLNVSNSLAAQEYCNLGVEYITLSPEITTENIKRITNSVKTIVYGYGHIPLMLTKACPLQNVRKCGECNVTGFLTDRKGMKMPIICHGKISGYREILNPIPLYMGDRISEIKSDYISLNFTTEDLEKVKEITEKFIAGKSFAADFTRGLYYKGSI